MKITYYGHSCLGAELGGKQILFDPFISGNPLAGALDVDNIPADYILVTHGHGDHTLDLLRIARRTGAMVVSNYEIVTWLDRQGIPNGHPMNHGGQWSFDFGRVKYVPAVHSSSFADGSYAGHPGGFVIESAEGCFYHSGDTALTMDMQLIPRFFKLDFAILPVGDNFTMGYQEALMAAEMLQCRKVVGVHFDTFDLVRIDHEAARAHFAAAGRELLLPAVGEELVL